MNVDVDERGEYWVMGWDIGEDKVVVVVVVCRMGC